MNNRRKCFFLQKKKIFQNFLCQENLVKIYRHQLFYSKKKCYVIALQILNPKKPHTFANATKQATLVDQHTRF